MKKLMILVSSLILVLTLAGCSFTFVTTANTSLTTTSPGTTTSATAGTTTATTTATTEIDLDALKQAVYDKIYQELYDQVRAEVIQNLSQERFDEIYNQVISDILDKVASGEITVTAASVIDMIYEVAANEATSVVGVTTYDSAGTSVAIGSGVIYKHVGEVYYVVTNNHVVEDGSSYEIRFEDGSTVSATLRGVDTLVDVAVLYFTSTNDYTVVNFGNSDTVAQGTIVLAVGNPSGYDYYRSITMGIVSGTNRYFDIDGDNTKDMFVGYIQHDASINAGNSGGALFNLQGEVIGINVIKIAATEIEGMGFAIPSNLVSAICGDIEEYGVSKQKPMLGISFLDISSTTQATWDYYHITIPQNVTQGFYISAVVANASFDGYVLPGDILTQVGDFTIINTQDFVYNFSKYRVGDIISITLIRNGSVLTFDNIELKSKPEA